MNLFVQWSSSTLDHNSLRHFRLTIVDGDTLVMPRSCVIALASLRLGLAFWFQAILRELLFIHSLWTAGTAIPTLAALTDVRFSKTAAF